MEHSLSSTSNETAMPMDRSSSVPPQPNTPQFHIRPASFPQHQHDHQLQPYYNDSNQWFQSSPHHDVVNQVDLTNLWYQMNSKMNPAQSYTVLPAEDELSSKEETTCNDFLNKSSFYQGDDHQINCNAVHIKEEPQLQAVPTVPLNSRSQQSHFFEGMDAMGTMQAMDAMDAMSKLQGSEDQMIPCYLPSYNYMDNESISRIPRPPLISPTATSHNQLDPFPFPEYIPQHATEVAVPLSTRSPMHGPSVTVNNGNNGHFQGQMPMFQNSEDSEDIKPLIDVSVTPIVKREDAKHHHHGHCHRHHHHERKEDSKKKNRRKRRKKRDRANDDDQDLNPKKKRKVEGLEHSNYTQKEMIEMYIQETMTKRETSRRFAELIRDGKVEINHDSFVCHVNGCDKTFKSRHHLKRHVDEIHVGRRYLCTFPQCPYAEQGRDFRQKSQCREHLKNLHFMLKGEWRCPFCDHEFTRWNGAKRHLELQRCRVLRRQNRTLSTAEVAQHKAVCRIKTKNGE